MYGDINVVVDRMAAADERRGGTWIAPDTCVAPLDLAAQLVSEMDVEPGDRLVATGGGVDETDSAAVLRRQERERVAGLIGEGIKVAEETPGGPGFLWFAGALWAQTVAETGELR